MTDRRRLASTGQTALRSLEGQVEAARFVDGTPARIIAPVADLRPAPDSPKRDRQVLYGADVTVIEAQADMSFVQAHADGYVGWVRSDALGAPAITSHTICVPASHAYSAADLKSPELVALSHGSRLQITGAEGAFFQTSEGWFVPRPHIRPANKPITDPATVAQLFFGVPYLWGGNSVWGIDCSGLVQAAFRACGIDCPGDSDMQEAELGDSLDPKEPLQRGDLLFWKGHVAMMVDADVLIHANASTMSVAYEPLDSAIFRIGSQGDGPVTSRRRVTRPL